MVDKALHGVLYEILTKASRDGLKGNQHFYVTFLTAHPDVQIPQHLKDEYPEEITVVLQHQFENLIISKDQFSVDLYFNDALENIKVPFSALISFLDPAVNWGLNFEPHLSDFSNALTPTDSKKDSTEPELKKEKKGVVVSFDQFRKK
jgi:hypothetical protein